MEIPRGLVPQLTSLLTRLDARVGELMAGLRPYRRILVLAGLLVIVGAALLARLTFASLAEHPGHADEAFYYTVAENLADGRGFVIDYVWHYFNPPATVTHPSNDYWLPLASIIISFSLLLFGKSQLAALLPAVLAGLALALLLYFWSKAYSPSTLVAGCAAVLALFHPILFAFSLTTGTVIYFALFASAGLFFMVRGFEHPRFFLPAAACAALGTLTRNDGPLLAVTLLVAILLSPHPRHIKSRYGVLSLTLYLLMLAPWLAYSYAALGSLFPGATKLLFVTEYEDRFAYAKELSLRTFLDWGIANIARSRLEAGLWNLKTLGFYGGVLWIPVIVAIVEAVLRPSRRPAFRLYLPPLFFIGSLLALHSLVSTFSTIMNSAVSIVPFLIVVAVETFRRHLRSAVVASLVVALLAFHYYTQSFLLGGTTVALNNEVGQQLVPVRKLLDEEAAGARPREVVVMTSIPWELYHSTRYRAVQIPNDDLPTVLAVARKYGANYLLLHGRRKALDGLYRGTASDPRFEHVATIPYSDPFFDPPQSNLKLFRIRLP